VLIGAREDVAAIAMERHGYAIGGEHLVQERGVAVEIFGRPEMQRDDLRRRIVDRAEKRERFATPLELRKGLPSSWSSCPAGASRGRRVRCWAGRRRWTAGLLSGRRKRTDSRETASLWTLRSFSVSCVSLKPA
jgi:hypothetical protein